MRVPQYKVNVYAARVLSRYGLPCRSEVRVGRGTPDLICMHPVYGAVIGEAEFGRSPLDESVRSRLEARVSGRFSEPVFKGFDLAVMLVYPERLAREAAVVEEERVESLVEEAEVGLGVAARVEDRVLYEWSSVPVKLRNVPVVYTSMLESLLRRSGVVTRGYREAIDTIVSIVEEYARSIAERYSRDEAFVERLRRVAVELGVAWDVIRRVEDRVYLTAKLLLILYTLMLILYEVARRERAGCLERLECRNLTVYGFIRSFEKLVEGACGVAYRELNSEFLPLLKGAPGNSLLDRALQQLCEEVLSSIYVIRAAGWYSISELYQRLLSETYRKAFATFYTRLQAARLLAALAIDRFDVTVVDPACGTGSLLLATLERRKLSLSREEAEKLIRESIASGKPMLELINDKLLGSTFGADALRPACYMTALNLRIAARGGGPPELNIAYAPVGEVQAGSLDILVGRHGDKLARLASRRFDVVIMNPPFTRSDRVSSLMGRGAREALSKAKLSFGGVPVRDLLRAGLAKPFLVLADKLLKDGGVLAAVLPNTVLSRESWADVRSGLLRGYSLEYIVVSWAPGTPSMSSDVQFREILLVARKGGGRHNLRIVNLYKRVDDLDIDDIERIALEAREARGRRIVVGKGGEPLAAILAVDASTIDAIASTGSLNLYRLVAFSDVELLDFHLKLVSRCSVELGKLFRVGSVIDHTSGLTVATSAQQAGRLLHVTPAVWGTGSGVVRQPILGEPRVYVGVAREDRVHCRYWREARTFYKARVFFLRRGQLDTQSVLMVATRFDAVSNTWWPLRPLVEWAVVLNYLAFFNSSFGLLHALGERLETRGLYCEFKKSSLESMPVPDLRGARPIVDEHVLSRPLPRFIEYLSVAASKGDDWRRAAEQLVESGTPYATRALLDLRVGEALREYCGIEPPPDLYKRLYEQVQTLRSVMEQSTPEERPPEDTGTAKRQPRTRRLDEWLKPKKR